MTAIMKRYIFLTLACVLAAACNLDRYQPYSDIAAGSYVKDEASCNNLVIGAYNALHSSIYYEWTMTELRTDNARMRGNNSTSPETKLIEQLDQGTILTANAWVQDYWDKTYAAIYRANNIFDYLDVVKNPEKKAQFEGEARFLRAYLYFNLVRLWGPVFLVDSKPTPEEARYMQRSSVDEVYTLIEGDLNAIIDNALLPERMADADLGRADLKAAKALLAKVYMTHYRLGDDRYAAAKNLLQEVITACGDPQSGSSLVAYDRVFDTDNEMNSEIIFAIRFLGGQVGLGSPFTTLFGPVNNGGNVALNSKHFNYPSDDLIAAYNANGTDLRKDVVLRESYMDGTTGLEVTGVNARYCNKFISKTIVPQYDAENDFPVIRLGDVILLYAEILNELGQDGALDYLNMIRERAGIAEYATGELTSKYAVREAIRKERRLELAMENQRWFDLLRWGTATSVTNEFFKNEIFYSGYSYTVNPIADWQNLLPIPLSVTSINKLIAQNPGY